MPAARVSLPILVAIALAAPGCGRPRPVDREWSADPDAVAQLGDEVEVGDYRVRPPSGYTKTPTPGGPPGLTTTGWTGTRRPDGTAPSFIVLIGIPPAGERLPLPEEGLAKMLDGIRKRRTNWLESQPERGRIGGLMFLKAEWRGTDSVTGRRMRGFVYLAIPGQKMIQLSSQDVEPHDADSLPVADAASLSFRRAEGP